MTGTGFSAADYEEWSTLVAFCCLVIFLRRDSGVHHRQHETDSHHDHRGGDPEVRISIQPTRDAHSDRKSTGRRNHCPRDTGLCPHLHGHRL